MARERREFKYATELKYQYSRIALFTLRALCKRAGADDPEDIEEFAQELGERIYIEIWVKERSKSKLNLTDPGPAGPLSGPNRIDPGG